MIGLTHQHVEFIGIMCVALIGLAIVYWIVYEKATLSVNIRLLGATLSNQN